MAQLFKPSANTLASASLVGAPLAAAVLFLGGSALSRSPYNTNVSVPIGQPVPFSHKHHAKELGIDCRFCHSSVEKAASAGIPSTDVCMTCHSLVWVNSPNLKPIRESWATGTPVQWARVNRVPDFVYFNHAIHVNKGISCNNCHGKVQEMHLTWKGQTFHMAWCLECHNNPERYLYAEAAKEGEAPLSPRQQVFELYRKISAGDPLSPVELALAEGLPQVVPDDAVHKRVKEGATLVKDRKINVSQLADCWICHR
jgi:hypothetical protein